MEEENNKLTFYTEEEIKNKKELNRSEIDNDKFMVLVFQLILALLSSYSLFSLMDIGFSLNPMGDIQGIQKISLLLTSLITSSLAFIWSVRTIMSMRKDYLELNSLTPILEDGEVKDIERIDILSNILTSDQADDEVKSHVKKLFAKEFITMMEYDLVISYINRLNEYKSQEKITSLIRDINVESKKEEA